MFGRLFRRSPEDAPPVPQMGWSTTYPQPEYVPPAGQPAARKPAARIRLVPNETLVRDEDVMAHIGELSQTMVGLGADWGVSVEIDTSDRTRPGEMRGGADPASVIAVVVWGLVAPQARRLIDRVADAVVDWVLAHRRTDQQHEPIIVQIYGPDGDVVKRVEVPQDGGDPVDKTERRRMEADQ